MHFLAKQQQKHLSTPIHTMMTNKNYTYQHLLLSLSLLPLSNLHKTLNLNSILISESAITPQHLPSHVASSIHEVKYMEDRQNYTAEDIYGYDDDDRCRWPLCAFTLGSTDKHKYIP